MDVGMMGAARRNVLSIGGDMRDHDVGDPLGAKQALLGQPGDAGAVARTRRMTERR
jgi:hypothetical protein